MQVFGSWLNCSQFCPGRLSFPQSCGYLGDCYASLLSLLLLNSQRSNSIRNQVLFEGFALSQVHWVLGKDDLKNKHISQFRTMLDWFDFQKLESQIKDLLLWNIKHTILKILVLKISCLNPYTKREIKLHAMNYRRRQNGTGKRGESRLNSVVVIWYLIRKLIAFSCKPDFFFTVQRHLFSSFCLLIPLPPAQLEHPQKTLAEVTSQKLFKF